MAKSNLQNLRRALDLVTTPPAAAPGGDFQFAGLAAEEQPSSWATHPNIQGFGIAERITKGQKLDEVALKVYVEKKLPPEKVDAPIPAQVMLPGMKEPVATDVQEIGKVQLEANTSRHRPAMPGCSLGHFQITAGTFGCLVRKKGKPELYVLSNSHVLANSGTGKKGDAVLQTSVFDGGVQPGDVICELAEWVPFKFGDNAFDNLVDAAIALVKNPADVTSAVNLIGVPKGISKTLRRGMAVKKCGRTTDLTTGQITDVEFRTSLTYPTPEGGEGNVGLRDQVLCTRYTAGGDSGAAVFNTKGEIVGLHFAGTPSTSIFNRITNVLDALGLEIVTQAI
ncbi:MAG TPA: trypsin-like serine protease [Thermoanaerobaculia bacterium]|nr:trypsin-like serine protease [Thermoanaerobaculia bacterium]